MKLAPLLAIAVLLTACATAPPEEGASDPLQPVNRGVFWVNDRIDRWAFEPVAKGWRWLAPEVVRHRLGLFLANLGFPVRFVGNLAQGELRNTGDELGRFVVNTTAGVLGFFDPATRLGLERHDEDFGQALGRWGIGGGPYLMLPIFGPSNPRDALGLVVDSALGYGPSLVSPVAGPVVWGVERVNTRADLIEEVQEARDVSLDYYVFVRNAYLQSRRAQIANGSGDDPVDAPTEDLYELPDD